MSNMPWRLQIAMAAMQSPHLEQLFNPLSTVENATQIYLLMADAMLAEHARTATTNQFDPRDPTGKNPVFLSGMGTSSPCDPTQWRVEHERKQVAPKNGPLEDDQAMNDMFEDWWNMIMDNHGADLWDMRYAKIIAHGAWEKGGEHARTAKVSSLNADDRENIRDLIAALRDERWKIGHMETYLHRNIVRDAANQLERLLNE